MIRKTVRAVLGLCVLGVVSVSAATAGVTIQIAESRTPVAALHAQGSQPAPSPIANVPAARPVPLIALVGFIALGIVVTLVLFRDHAVARVPRSVHNDR